MFYFSSAVFNHPIFFTEVYQYVYADKEMKTDHIFTIKALKEEAGWVSTLTNKFGEIQFTTHSPASTYQSALISAVSCMMLNLSKNIEEKIKPELRLRLNTKEELLNIILDNSKDLDSLCKTLSELIYLGINLKGIIEYSPIKQTDLASLLNSKVDTIDDKNNNTFTNLRVLFGQKDFRYCKLKFNSEDLCEIIKTNEITFSVRSLITCEDEEKPFICYY